MAEMDKDTGLKLQAKRVIVPHSEGDNPELEPLFANHCELMRMGADIFLDVGMVLPSEMQELMIRHQHGEAPVSVTFHVLQRVAMSIDTLRRLRENLNDLCDKLQEGATDVSSQGETETKKLQ